MSHTPPDFGRPARTIAEYLYAGTRGLDFPSPIFNTDQPGHGPYHSDIEAQVNGQNRGRLDQTHSSLNDGRSSRARDDDGSNRMRDSYKGRDMNPALEDFKRDSDALNVMPRTNEYDTFTNGYSVTDQTMRTFSNPKNLQAGSFPDRHYPHLQPHPSSMSGLQQFLQPRPSVYHQPSLDPAFSYKTMFNSLVKAQYDFNNPYTRPSISPAYPGLGQSAPRLNIYPDFSTADPEMNFFNKKYPSMYPSSPIPVPAKPYDVDPHLMPRYQRSEEIPGYMTNYPRTHSVPNKPYLGNVTDISRSQPAPSNGIKHGNNSVIDLTSPTSPGTFRNPSHRSDVHQERSHARSNTQDIRNMPKENGNHQQPGPSGSENRNSKPLHYPHSSSSPYSNSMSYPGPLPIPSYNSGQLNHPENSHGDMRALPKPVEHLKPAMHNPWGSPNKHHNSSPRQISGSDLGKKSPSSHILSKDLSQSEITFNYPEASANRYDTKKAEPRGTPTKRNVPVEAYGQCNEHEKYGNSAVPPRNHPWNKSNESALTPLEHYVIEKAREGKLPSNAFRKVEDPYLRYPPYQQKNHQQQIPSPKDDRKINHENDKKEIDAMRNSVIQPMVVSPGEKVGEVAESDEIAVKEDIELDSVQSDLYVNTAKPDPMHASSMDIQNFDQQATDGNQARHSNQVPSENTSNEASHKNTKYKRKTSVVKADGTPRVKRAYVKRSEVWNTKGKRKKKDSTNKISPKISDSTHESAVPKTATESPLKTVKHAIPPEKLTRPQRKSTGLDMDEYLYGYVFSDEETENDDSSDEDYSCPSNVNKIRTSKQIFKPLRRTRRSTRSQNDSTVQDEEHVEAEITQRKRRRRRWRFSETTSNIAANQDAIKEDTIKNMGNTPTQNMTPENQLSDVAHLPTDVVCPNNQLKTNIITQEMAEKMVKDIGIVAQVNETVCVSTAKTVASSDVVEAGAVMKETNSIPLNELKIAVAATAVRTKRKYTRKLDENGNPIKRAKKLKSVEIIPRKRRKYEKKAEKWFIKKNLDQQQIQDKQATTIPECNDVTHSNEVNASLAFETKNQPVRARIATTDQHNMLGKSSVTAVSKGNACNPHNNLDDVSEKENIAHSECVDTKSDSTSHDLRSSTTTEIPNNKISGPVGIKIRKKPGRKPGSRKYPARDKDPLGGVMTPAVLKYGMRRKKYKNPGDGLKRFGRRKKGRRGRLRKNNFVNLVEKRNLMQATPITSTPTSSKFDNTNAGTTHKKRKYDNSRRLEKKRQRLMHMGIFQEKEFKRKECEGTMATRNHTSHEISLELQSQEYLFDAKDISWHQNVQGKEEGDSTDEANLEELSEEAFLLKSESSVTGIAQSPFPPSMKKLTCNSAIGETPLHKAARLGYVENVRYYLETGANVNQCDNAGYTALHKACVHNNLEAASLLLEYGADVNKHAADGTRPFHDAVEYDHLEMARLMLACGADPMLSKFSGRAVQNMIRSEKMGKFMNAYLRELKEPTSETAEVEWKFERSLIFEKQVNNGCYKSADFAPEAEPLSIEFELYGELPIPCYLLQPDDENEWANFYLLDDYLNCTSCKRNHEDKKVRIITMPTKKFLEQIHANKVQCITYEKARNKPDTSSNVIEIVAVDKELMSSIGAQTITTPLFEDVARLTMSSTPPHKDISKREQSESDDLINKSATMVQRGSGDAPQNI